MQGCSRRDRRALFLIQIVVVLCEHQKMGLAAIISGFEISKMRISEYVSVGNRTLDVKRGSFTLKIDDAPLSQWTNAHPAIANRLTGTDGMLTARVGLVYINPLTFLARTTDEVQSSFRCQAASVAGVCPLFLASRRMFV